MITIVASDADEGNNSFVDLTFVKDDNELNGYRFFYIQRDSPQANQFTIRQNVTFDRETATQYKVSLFVCCFCCAFRSLFNGPQ